MKYHEVLRAAVLAAGGVAIGCVFLCIAPFAAAATLAVGTLSRRAAFAALRAMWLANQAIGFGFRHYPHDASTFAWGAAILAATLVAAACASRLRQLPLAFLAAFAGYEGTLFAYSLVVHERDGFSATIVGEIFLANVAGAIVLGALRGILDASLGERLRVAR